MGRGQKKYQQHKQYQHNQNSHVVFANPMPIQNQNNTKEEIFYDALDYIPTAQKLSFGYAVTMGATIGYITGYGVIPGIILPAIDEGLIRYGYTKSHWLSKTALSVIWSGMPISAISTSLGTYASYSIGVIATAISIKFSNDIFDKSKEIAKIVDSTNVLQQILDPEDKISSQELFKIISTFRSNPVKAIKIAQEDIKYLMHNKLAQNTMLHITQGFASTGLDQMYMSYTGVVIQGGAFNLLLSYNNPESSQGFSNAVSGILGSVMLYSLKNCLQSLMSMYVRNHNNELSIFLEQLVQARVYNKNNIITNIDEDGLRHDDIMANASQDIINTLQLSTLRLNQMIGKCSSIPGALNIICSSNSMLILSINIIKDNISIKLNEWINSNIQDDSHLATDIKRIQSVALTNFREVVLSNNDKMMGEKLYALKQKQNKIELSSQFFQNFKNNIGLLLDRLFQCCDALCFLEKIMIGSVEMTQIPVIEQNVKMFTGTLGLITLSSEEQKLKRLKILFAKKTMNTNFREIDIDEVSGNVEFNNYSLTIGDKTYVKVNNIKFSSGYHVINAPSGTGKSSMLQDIIYPLSGNIKSNGNIKLPCSPEKIIYISQKGFLLPSGISSIFESIISKDVSKIAVEAQEKYIKNILALAQEIGLSLNEQKLCDKFYSLSGGEIKKICIIKVIIKSQEHADNNIIPVIMLDEIFNELDSKSVLIVQKVIKKTIPKNAIVILVDHNVELHKSLENGDYFYDSLVELDDHGSDSIMQFNTALSGEIGF